MNVQPFYAAMGSMEYSEMVVILYVLYLYLIIYIYLVNMCIHLMENYIF